MAELVWWQHLRRGLGAGGAGDGAWLFYTTGGGAEKLATRQPGGRARHTQLLQHSHILLGYKSKTEHT